MGGGKASLRDILYFFENFEVNHGVIKKTAVLNLHFHTCSSGMYWLYF